MGKIFVGQVGVLIDLDTQDTLEGATLLQILYEKPSGDTGVWTATPTSTRLQYTTLGAAGEDPADLDESGNWKLQTYVEGSGFALRGETVVLPIFPAFG